MRLSPKKLAVAQRRQEVASMYLRAEPQWRIAHHFGVHPGQISRDLRAIQKQWEKAALLDLDKVKTRELARIDEIERQAWGAWDRSRKDAETMEVTGTSQGGKSKPDKVRKITKGQAGDPRFLELVKWCVEMRLRLVGALREAAGPTTVVTVIGGVDLQVMTGEKPGVPYDRIGTTSGN